MFIGSISGSSLPHHASATDEAALATTQPPLDEAPPPAQPSSARPHGLVTETAGRHRLPGGIYVRHANTVTVQGPAIIHLTHRRGPSARRGSSEANAHDPFEVFRTDPFFTQKSPASAALPAQLPQITAHRAPTADRNPPGARPLESAAVASVRSGLAPVPSEPATPSPTRGQLELDRYVGRMVGSPVWGVRGTVTTTVTTSTRHMRTT